jgi:hypothetical protein
MSKKKAKGRPTIGTDGQPLPVLPPERDPRVSARMVRVLFYTPGFLAVLLLKAGEPTAFGLTVELLMLASAAAIVGGLFIATQSSGLGADLASRCGVWSGALVIELLAVVPFLCAIPVLFHELANTALLHVRDSAATNVPLGVSELLPAAAVVPFMLYQLAGFGTLHYVVSRSVNWCINFAILGLIVASYVSNRLDDFSHERAIGILLVVGMGVSACYGILKLRRMQADFDSRCPSRKDTEAGTSEDDKD